MKFNTPVTTPTAVACAGETELQPMLPFVACEPAAPARVAPLARAERLSVTPAIAAPAAAPAAAAIESAVAMPSHEDAAAPSRRPVPAVTVPTAAPPGIELAPAIPPAPAPSMRDRDPLLDYPNVPWATEVELRPYARPRPRLFVSAENSVIWQEILERRRAAAAIGGAV